MEVEREKTTINNMDLLDVWKCHICEKCKLFIFNNTKNTIKQ